MADEPAPVVRAAGCVLWRRPRTARTVAGDADGIEIALVHRPKWDDWSHPKGKLKRGETALAAAVREVREETGMSCVPGAVLPTVRYTAQGRPKTVDYWAAEATGGAFVPGDEVDRLLWLPPGQARERLTREQDRELVDALLAALNLH
ncbi:NUDIX hydrolase [Streptomyces sp. TRM 70361]|uniref:NUDIX hydrolase n=1 Tax=Streptomyces sp. TRM 70361 TaxID=3116553 RepID=UPI002E7B9467|nr:NUDIX hydrolase [Streptomyces sp. TRM 70361]MEE1942269.1 NUDIX hydrolase [Streptomyces sp. TRM 70361]